MIQALEDQLAILLSKQHVKQVKRNTKGKVKMKREDTDDLL